LINGRCARHFSNRALSLPLSFPDASTRACVTLKSSRGEED
jgi:hypothetical protein